MNDNDIARDALARILGSFSPSYIESLQRLAIAQNELLPLKIAILTGFLVPATFLIAFWEFWLNGDFSLLMLAGVSTASIVFSGIGYISIRRLERSMGMWKVVVNTRADKVVGGTGWIFVPLGARSMANNENQDGRPKS
jgi:hypothetical protein